MAAPTTQRSASREMTEAPAQAQSPRIGRSAAALAGLGLAGSSLLAVTGSRVANTNFDWWFRVVINPISVERVLFYVGMVSLVLAWLGFARSARRDRMRPAWIAAVAFLWSVPLLIGPPLFSHDLYSYYAQGMVAHLGPSPYLHAPAILGPLGHHRVLNAVDPFWRHATSPYGPLFLGIVSVIAGLTGAHVYAGFVLVRLLDFLGLPLLAVFVPRLARRIGGDPTRATWLTVASPLVLLQLVSPGHNDLLMVGLMVAGVALALERHPLLGIVVCMVAATIKLPAAGAALFIAVAWLRSGDGSRARVEIAAKAIAAALITTAAITLVTGFGLRWISTSLFSTPGRVHLAITPATAFSYTIAKLLSAAGAAVSFGEVKPVMQTVFVAASVLIGLALLARTRWHTLTSCLGLTLVAFAVGGPALWPWYLAWGLALLAAWERTQNSAVFVVVIVVGSFLVRADGILLLPFGSSPVLAAIWLLIAVVALIVWRRRARSSAPVSDGLGRARSALAER